MAFRSLKLLLAIALLFGFRPGLASAMTFELISDPQACAARTCVMGAGVIDSHTADDFVAFVRAHAVGRGALVVLNSPGGDLLQSLVLGNRIRAAGFATTVQGYDREKRVFTRGGVCASGCAYAFLGGVERTVGPGSRIGVHQVWSPQDAPVLTAADAMELMSLVATHVNRLCGNLDLLIPTMNTRPQGMHWLSAGELTRYAVITTSTGTV